jgi:hypothetical protein
MAEDVSVCGVWFGRDDKGEKLGVNSFLMLPLSNTATDESFVGAPLTAAAHAIVERGCG